MNNCLCGGKPKVILDGIYYVYCLDCGEESCRWAKRNEAIANWNTLTTQTNKD